jgi:chromosomal replication initiator protein
VRRAEVQVSESVINTPASESIVTEIETRLATRLGSHRYRMWFQEHAVLAIEAETLVVRVGSRFAAEWIERNFAEELNNAATLAAGVKGVRIVADDRAPEMAAEPPTSTSGARQGPGAATTGGNANTAAPATARGATNGSAPAIAHAWRKFDDFVVGASNRVGFEAARRLADDTLGGIRSILLHGGCGVGKTHLLQALCAERKRHFAHERVRYTTGEQFTNEYIHAVRGGDVETFRTRVRKLDLLAIDDVHFLSNKGATQTEFLHTIDAIGLAGARVAIVTDAHPRALASFSEALVSRLLGGMVVQVDPPDRQTRETLVVRLAAARGLEIDSVAVSAVTDRILGSVREIEGALARIAAAMLVEDASSAGLALVERALATGAHMGRGAPPRIGSIVDAACDALGVGRDEITSNGRHRRVVLARGVVVHLAREMTTMSYPEIARHLGRTAHSTAHAASERVTQMLQSGHQLRPGDCPCGARSVRELVETVRRSAERAGNGGR